MSRLRRHKNRNHEAVELNITAFLNLMVVLVPFLLISAVFSQVAILDLNMPDPNKQSKKQDKADEEKKERVEVILREGKIQVNNGTAIALSIEEGEDGTFDIAQLTEYLRGAKERQPEKLDATILLEPEIEYERLIRVMDTIKIDVQEQGEGEEPKRVELFPVVSIGDAPVLKNETAGGAQ